MICKFSVVGQLETQDVHDEVQTENRERLRDEEMTDRLWKQKYGHCGEDAKSEECWLMLQTK